MTIARSGGEGLDLPRDVNQEMADNPYFSYTNNSEEYTDFEDGQGYLELTRPEKDMIELAKKTSTKTIVVINAANVFQLGDLQDDPEIDAIVWAIPGGPGWIQRAGPHPGWRGQPVGEDPRHVPA